MMKTELSPVEARRLILHQQGLSSTDQFGRGLSGAHKAINRLGYLQIDTISVVQRAHDHVLGTRVSNYKPGLLDQLQQQGKVFEYWAHAAAYLPMDDFRFSLPIMARIRRNTTIDKTMAAQVLDRIRAEGPLSARDFDAPDHTGGGWWNWKPAKITLENLFLSGELMVRERRGFQKVYDLTHRVITPDVDTRTPNDEEWSRFHVQKALRALGIATPHEIAYMRTTIGRRLKHDILPGIKSACAEMQAEGELHEVTVNGVRYLASNNQLQALPSRLGRRLVRFLSPFDNLLIQRKRTLELFGFDYQLESYVPAAKRRYGYFALPVLWGDKLVGRLDARADRKQRILELINLQMEQRYLNSSELRDSTLRAIPEFARRNGCDRCTVQRTKPAHYLPDELDCSADKQP